MKKRNHFWDIALWEWHILSTNNIQVKNRLKTSITHMNYKVWIKRIFSTIQCKIFHLNHNIRTAPMTHIKYLKSVRRWFFCYVTAIESLTVEHEVSSLKYLSFHTRVWFLAPAICSVEIPKTYCNRNNVKI